MLKDYLQRHKPAVLKVFTQLASKDDPLSMAWYILQVISVSELIAIPNLHHTISLIYVCASEQIYIVYT